MNKYTVTDKDIVKTVVEVMTIIAAVTIIAVITAPYGSLGGISM